MKFLNAVLLLVSASLVSTTPTPYDGEVEEGALKARYAHYRRQIPEGHEVINPNFRLNGAVQPSSYVFPTALPREPGEHFVRKKSRTRSRTARPTASSKVASVTGSVIVSATPTPA